MPGCSSRKLCVYHTGRRAGGGNGIKTRVQGGGGRACVGIKGGKANQVESLKIQASSTRCIQRNCTKHFAVNCVTLQGLIRRWPQQVSVCCVMVHPACPAHPLRAYVRLPASLWLGGSGRSSTATRYGKPRLYRTLTSQAIALATETAHTDWRVELLGRAPGSNTHTRGPAMRF
jgi:hypothetical protein